LVAGRGVPIPLTFQVPIFNTPHDPPRACDAGQGYLLNLALDDAGAMEMCPKDRKMLAARQQQCWSDQACYVLGLFVRVAKSVSETSDRGVGK